MKRFSLQILTIIGVLMVMGLCLGANCAINASSRANDPFLCLVEMAVGGKRHWVGILNFCSLDGANRCTSDSTDDTSLPNHHCIFVLAQALGTQQSPPIR